jgi:glycine cleavage system H protein
MIKYSETHEWVLVVNHIATIGVTDYAQQELGDIVYVELPKVGKKVAAGGEVVVLESTKAAADVYSPVSGTITEVNTALQGRSELINKSPELEGWLYRIELDNPQEVDELMDKDSYLKMIGKI